MYILVTQRNKCSIMAYFEKCCPCLESATLIVCIFFASIYAIWNIICDSNFNDEEDWIFSNFYYFQLLVMLRKRCFSLFMFFGTIKTLMKLSFFCKKIHSIIKKLAVMLFQHISCELRQKKRKKFLSPFRKSLE